MGYIKRKTSVNAFTTEDRLSFIQDFFTTGKQMPALNKIVEVSTGEELNLTSQTAIGMVMPTRGITNQEVFNIRYGGENYTITVDIFNKVYGLEDDNGRHLDLQGILTAAESGVTREQEVAFHMQHTGAITEPVVTIKVVGGIKAHRDWIARNFTMECEVRNTHVDHASQQAVETYWNWWKRPVGDSRNNRRTIIHQFKQDAGTYSVTSNAVFDRQLVSNYTSWALVGTYSNDDTTKTSIFNLNLNVGVSNVAGEQGIIAGVYNWDVKFDSKDLLDKEPTP